jgi:NADPH-dependent curcumin reductase CurA
MKTGSGCSRAVGSPSTTNLPAVKIGEVARSMGAGRIEASNHPDFAVGDIVSGLTGR